MKGKMLLGAGFFGAAALILLLSIGLAGRGEDPGTDEAAHARAVEGSRSAASAAGRLPAGDHGRPVLDAGPPVADAAMKGDLATVRALLEEGADVNAAQGDGTTPLHWAALDGDAELAELLVYAGATLKATTRAGGHTPLHLAARAGHADVIGVLLSAGGDPGARSATGVTPLHLAAASGSRDAVDALLAGGADADTREDAHGQSPLIFATADRRLETMDALLRAGADPGLTTRVVDFAAREEADRRSRRARARRVEAVRKAREEQEAAERMLSDPTAELVGKDGATKGEAGYGEDEDEDEEERPQSREERGEDEPEPLSYAELVGEQGGMAALHYAAREGHVEAARTLLDAGADVNQVTEGDGSCPLLVAVVNGNYDLALLLLERGANPKLASDAGATPLFATLNNRWAPKALYPQPTAFKQQETSYLELMEALLVRGADPNARLEKHLWYTSYNFDLLGVDFWGATPFWRAAYATDVEAMKLLVAHGADPAIPTRKPAQRRRRGDDEEKEDQSGLPPVPVGGPGVLPIHAASGVGYGQEFAANSHRHVPGGWLAAVKYLVEELGADVNARDHDGYAPLHHAAARGDNELILYLVEQGADVMVVSRAGQTTVDMANGPQQRVQPFPETIELLESLGAINNHNCVSC